MFETGKPVIVAEPETATQADVALAYPETVAAWGQCAFNMGEIRRIVEGVPR